jgi:hypothetical protein
MTIFVQTWLAVGQLLFRRSDFSIHELFVVGRDACQVEL